MVVKDNLIEKVIKLCHSVFGEAPATVERCAVGHGNFVYKITYSNAKYIFRGSLDEGAYKDTIKWLKRLEKIGITASKVIASGKFDVYEYMFVNYIEGKELWEINPELTDAEKRGIAKEIVEIQEKAAALETEKVQESWSWKNVILEMLDRAEERIVQNGYFDVEKVNRLRGEMEQFNSYFESIEPIPYLDDLSTKNLLIHEGKISGIIDVDWVEVGDKLTYVALTNMALLDKEYDTDYVKYILDEMQVSEVEQRVFLFYTLMYCVDFMGERGMQFNDKRVPVDKEIVEKLNRIYESLWQERR